ncbi:MAG: hypothetical protein ACO1NS_14590 [Daejeonella sp.]
MKKVLLTLAVSGTIFLSGCEKNETIAPEEKTSLKADDLKMCGGCGQWDIVEPDPEASTMRVTSSTTTDSTSASAKPGKSKK